MGESLLFSLNSTMPLFFVMVLGYLLRRFEFVKDDFVAMANKLVFYVSLPVQLFRDMASMDVRAVFDGKYVVFCAVVTTVSILVIWSLAKVLLKDKHIVGEFVQACYRSSAAILGAAFIQNIYGTSGMSGLMILGSVPLYNIFAILILTLECPTRDQKGSMGARLKKSVKSLFTNPILIGIVTGFVWSFLRLPMPAMAGKTISSIASLTSPLALLAIGAGFQGRAALKACTDGQQGQRAGQAGDAGNGLTGHGRHGQAEKAPHKTRYNADQDGVGEQAFHALFQSCPHAAFLVPGGAFQRQDQDGKDVVQRHTAQDHQAGHAGGAINVLDKRCAQDGRRGSVAGLHELAHDMLIFQQHFRQTPDHQDADRGDHGTEYNVFAIEHGPDIHGSHVPEQLHRQRNVEHQLVGHGNKIVFYKLKAPQQIP